MIVPVKCKADAIGNCMDLDGNGTFDGYPDSIQQPATSLVTDAHGAGLLVHEYTFRSEKGYYNLPYDARSDPLKEYLTHYRLGVDGVFRMRSTLRCTRERSWSAKSSTER